MKKKISFVLKSSYVRLSVLLFALISVVGCKEEIDESNAVIKTGIMMTEYFEQNATEFSHIKSIFDRVRFGDKESGNGQVSTISSALRARGNYTCFAPTNAALENYTRGLIGTSDVSQLSYEQAQFVAYSCLIDNGDEAAYLTTDFVATGNSLNKSTFNHRVLDYTMNAEGDFVVGKSKILTADIEVDNGVLHKMEKVIAPPTDLLVDRLALADNMRIISKLLKITGWADKLVEESDREYEQTTHPDEMEVAGGDLRDVPVFKTRLLGYTAFVEPDDVLCREWGLPAVQYNDVTEEITNWSEIYEIIKTKCAEAYPGATDGVETNANNAVNRFVAYHVVEGRLAWGKMVAHFNEFRYGYGKNHQQPQQDILPINVWDYYVTIGEKPEILKITQVGHNDKGLANDIRLNRVSKHETKKTYNEISVINEGALVSQYNGDNSNNASNGFYYPIDRVLVCDADTKSKLASERIRFDYVTMMPELASNLIRQTGKKGTSGNDYWAFPNGYFSSVVKQTDDTKITYMFEPFCTRGEEHTWKDYQGDEFIFGGVYDFTLKLPPPPRTGTYEVRIGISTNNLRGMAAMYFGPNDPNAVELVGLPLDMRQSATDNQNIPWADDVDEENNANASIINQETDKNMRNAGYMKAPAYVCISNADGVTDVMNTIRKSPAALRKIITTQTLYENTNYYLRIKSALSSNLGQLFLDYFEYVPTSVYNGAEAEDMW